MNGLLSINHGLIKSRAVINGAKVFFASETVLQSQKELVLRQLRQIFPQLEGDKVLLINKQTKVADALPLFKEAQKLGYIVVVNQPRQVSIKIHEEVSHGV